MTPADDHHEPFEDLRAVVLEDSWVRSFHIADDVASFVLDVRLLPSHPHLVAVAGLTPP